MKRILILLGVIGIILCGSLTASAQELNEPKYTCGYDFKTGILSIDGACEKYPHAKVALEILKNEISVSENYENYVFLDICSSDENGAFSFKAKMPNVQDTYKIRVSLYWTEISEQEVFIANEDEILSKIKSAKSPDEMNDAIHLCSVALDVENELSDADKLSNPKKIMEIMYNENVKGNLTDIESVKKAFHRGIVCEVCAEASDFSVAESIVGKYKDELDLVNLNIYSACCQDGNYHFGSDIAGKSYSEYPKFYEGLISALLRTAIANSPGYSRINAYLTEAKPLLNELDLSVYNTLNDYQKSEIDRNINRRWFTSIGALNTELIKKKENNTPTGGGGGGGGNSSGSRISVNDVYNIVTDTNNGNKDNTVSRFSDLSEAKWAEAAVLELNKKGIINGYDDGTFKPNSTVKREEFIKMLSVFGMESTSSDIPFSDVKQNDWFYPYVCKAYSIGAINGNTDGTLGIGNAISRQDAVTMIYRVIAQKLISSDENKIFVDDSDIADYSREAVYVMSSNKIVQGNDEGKFNPKKSLTRAEAAKIFYELLQKGVA